MAYGFRIFLLRSSTGELVLPTAADVAVAAGGGELEGGGGVRPGVHKDRRSKLMSRLGVHGQHKKSVKLEGDLGVLVWVWLVTRRRFLQIRQSSNGYRRRRWISQRTKT
ncbi:hypothetical protein SLA2020_021310 [Shorea laevis]